MIEAIIYESNTGFTEKYAQMLSKELNLPSCPAGEIKKTFSPGIEAIYMGWICDKRIRGLEKAQKYLHIEAVITVGILSPTPGFIALLHQYNDLMDLPVFYLRGGIQREKLSISQKLILNLMAKKLAAPVKKGGLDSISNADYQVVDSILHNNNFVRKENLEEFLFWYHTQIEGNADDKSVI